MKKVLLSLFIVFGILSATQTALANVYASQMEISNPDSTEFDGSFADGSGALIWFFLNDTATAVTIDIIDTGSSSSVATIELADLSRGQHAIPWDGSGTESMKEYNIQVFAEQPNASSTEWTQFFDSGRIFIFTRGVATVTDQTDPNFGLTFTSNDGGPLETGINIYNPDGSFHDPFLVAADITSGGTIDYGTDAPIFAHLDAEGRIFVSNKDLGQIMRINRDYSTQVVIEGLTFPKGIYLEGEGEDFTIYVAADNQVLRANIGTAETFDAANMELIANFSGFLPHQVMLDDDGALYCTLRSDNSLGSDGRGIRKYDISGTLPVTDNQASWFLGEDRTFIANDLLLDSGADPSTSADDILYFCTRAGSGFDQDGIWRIDDINSFFPDTVRIVTENTFYGADDNINARATMDFDAAGNIILMENSNEHVFFFSPPGEGATNSFTSTSAEAFTVDEGLVGIETISSAIPSTYQLEDNFPNPFNPSTTIRYQLAASGFTQLRIFNTLGEEVRTLVYDNQTAGTYSATWDGLNNAGQQVASGIYIYSLKSGDFFQSKRMTFLK